MQYANSEKAKSAINLIFLIKLLEHAQQTIRTDLLAHIKIDDETDVTCRLLEADNHIEAAITTLCARDR